MNDHLRVVRRAARASLQAAQVSAALIAATLLLAACGGSPSAGSGGSPGASGSAVAYSACMRAHSVPNYPDPSSSGILPKTDARALRVATSRYQAAQSACQAMLPDSASESFDDQVRQCYLAGACPPTLVQQMMTHGRTIAGCMRSHGIPNWPDPTLDPQGRPFFDLSSQGISRSQSHSQQYEAKEGLCSRLASGGLASG
jgi:hypothetical protein